MASCDARFTNTEFVTEFLELYKLHPCLWKVKSPEYLNRNKRDVAYQSLVDLCKKINTECDVKFVKKKIANLRNSFRKEHGKVQRSKKSGAGASDIYVPKLWYYKLLEFTGDQEEPRESRSSIDDTEQDTQAAEDDFQIINPDADEKETQVEEQSNSACTPSSTPCKPPVRRAPKKRKANSNLVEEALAVLSKPSDECDAFGVYIGTELREMNDVQRALAKQQISQIVFNGRMNQLSQYQSANFNSSNCAPAYQTGYYSTTDPNAYFANPQGESVSCAQPIPSPTCSNSSNSNVSFHNM